MILAYVGDERLKKCSECNHWKQLTEDNFKKKKLKGWASVCRVCRTNRPKKGAT